MIICFPSGLIPTDISLIMRFIIFLTFQNAKIEIWAVEILNVFSKNSI